MRGAFGDFYRGRKALVTGHTGFKGSWLALWLAELGAEVVGYALDPPSDPSNFKACRLATRIVDVRGDVRDQAALADAVRTHRPDVIFHLAAQALVRRSFADPAATFATNVMGTVNVLDAAVRCDSVQAAVVITSDKCYRNREWVWGYRETDTLGGSDPYSASKGGAELAVACYQDPIVQRTLGRETPLPIASVRAGNVVGGGDWAADRLVPDIVRAVVARSDITIRDPRATRPWQHVVEPLAGYLWLARLLATDGDAYVGGWNFGPHDSAPLTVAELVGKVLGRWAPPATTLILGTGGAGMESTLLQLDCSKARHRLGWRVIWSIDQTVEAIVEWYSAHAEQPNADLTPYARRQITAYTDQANALGLAWAQTSPPASVEQPS